MLHNFIQFFLSISFCKSQTNILKRARKNIWKSSKVFFITRLCPGFAFVVVAHDSCPSQLHKERIDFGCLMGGLDGDFIEEIFFTALIVNTLQLILFTRIEEKLSGSVNFSGASSINHRKYFLSPFNDEFANAWYGRKEDDEICSAAFVRLGSRKMLRRAPPSSILVACWAFVRRIFVR